MTRGLYGAEQSLEFLVPGFLLAIGVAIAISIVFKIAGSKTYRVAMPLGSAIRLATVFAAFGYVLGVFVGITANDLTAAVLGSITTTGTTFLAYYYGKDAIPDADKILPPALISLFLVAPLMIEYVRLAQQCGSKCA